MKVKKALRRVFFFKSKGSAARGLQSRVIFCCFRANRRYRVISTAIEISQKFLHQLVDRWRYYNFNPCGFTFWRHLVRQIAIRKSHKNRHVCPPVNTWEKGLKIRLFKTFVSNISKAVAWWFRNLRFSCTSVKFLGKTPHFWPFWGFIDPSVKTTLGRCLWPTDEL